MNEQVAKYLERKQRLDEANAHVEQLEKDYRKAISDAKEIALNAFYDHINNGGSGTCGNSQFVQKLPEYMDNYYKELK